MRHRMTGMSPHMGVGQGATGFVRRAPFSTMKGFDSDENEIYNEFH